MNGCGCTDCPAEPLPVPKGKCPSYIGRVTEKTVGDCHPHSLYSTMCFCKRDGVQNVQGTSGCPSYPTLFPVGGNSTDILLFYNMGDGKTVGMAQGSMEGPWKVVKEPYVTGVQNVWPYQRSGGVMHFFADVLKEDGSTGIRHIATPDEGKTWVIAQDDAVDNVVSISGANTTTRSHPRLYRELLYSRGGNATQPSSLELQQRLMHWP